MATQPEPVDYPEVFRALGTFVQQQHLAEVAITEFERGWIVAGLTFKSTAQGFLRVPIDFVISHDEIRALITQMREQRKVEPQRRRWMR
jgi:hypothetical protein